MINTFQLYKTRCSLKCSVSCFTGSSWVFPHDLWPDVSEQEELILLTLGYKSAHKQDRTKRDTMLYLLGVSKIIFIRYLNFFMSANQSFCLMRTLTLTGDFLFYTQIVGGLLFIIMCFSKGLKQVGKPLQCFSCAWLSVLKGNLDKV